MDQISSCGSSATKKPHNSFLQSNPTIVSEAEINPNLYFNASNLKDGVKERTDMTEVDDYLMNKDNYKPKIKPGFNGRSAAHAQPGPKKMGGFE